MKATQQTVDLQCYHCGDICHSHKLDIADKSFCCNGCRSVYLLLNAHQLDNYYCLNEKPGATMRKIQPEKFSFLEDKTIASKLLEFSNATQAQVTLHLPQMHCSSCLWLLENLSRIQEGIITSRVNYNTKELTVAYEHAKLDLKTLAQLLTKIGYEPHISLQNLQVEEEKLKVKKSRTAYYKLGITGFCFANIMLISFPEYLGMEALEQQKLTSYFRLINLCLALPVVFYGASEFFRNAWYSFKQKYINIDAPIALAVSITFLRSVYEVITQTGSGYFDSMSGIVFFMLLGRTLQNRTYSTLSFNRDYKSYFPIAVTTLQKGVSRITKIQEIKEQDVLLLHHQEIIPTDCILSTGKAAIDYSFITGESIIERPQIGDLLYAGGKVAGSAIEVIAVKCFKQNSFTKLWNNRAFGEQISDKETSTTIISKYFSTMVILIAIGAFCYWQWENPQNAWNALTAVLIVACPCSLLLTTTFTNGYLLDFFSRKGLFIRNAQVIESLSKVDHIAFDKTGTITEAQHSSIIVDKMQLSKEDKKIALSIMSQSLHPLSRAIVAHYNRNQFLKIQHIKEIPGQGIEAWVNDQHFKIGQYSFVTNQERPITLRTEVYVSIDHIVKAHFIFKNHVKSGVPSLIQQLESYELSMVSGDNYSSEQQMRSLFPDTTTLLYQQSPQQKLEHIKQLQQEGKQVMMVGDGLNDAGALQQSNVGIAIVQQSFSFTPSCAAILEASQLKYLPTYLKLAKAAQRMILIGFAYSIIFNIIGIYFAVSAQLSPLIAAIIMPSSSVGIILIAFMGIQIATRKHKIS